MTLVQYYPSTGSISLAGWDVEPRTHQCLDLMWGLYPDLPRWRAWISCSSMRDYTISVTNSKYRSSHICKWPLNYPRGGDPVLNQHWSNVCDVGPMLSRHWVMSPCKLDTYSELIMRRLMKYFLFQDSQSSLDVTGITEEPLNLKPSMCALSQCWFHAG